VSIREKRGGGKSPLPHGAGKSSPEGRAKKAFCVGADLKEKELKGDVHVTSFWDGSFKLPMRGAELFNPVIAAINGHCLGGGLSWKEGSLASEGSEIEKPI